MFSSQSSLSSLTECPRLYAQSDKIDFVANLDRSKRLAANLLKLIHRIGK